MPPKHHKPIKAKARKTAEGDEDQDENSLSLPQLQNFIRRDPEAYIEDYRRQFEHFRSTAETLQLRPGRPQKSFNELTMFIAHVFHCYPNLREELNFPEILLRYLSKDPQQLHPEARRSMVGALLLIRSRGMIPLMKILPTLFRLFACDDKELRRTLQKSLLNDIINSTSTVGKAAGKKRKRRLNRGNDTTEASKGEKTEEKASKYLDPAPGLLRKDVQNFLVQQINKNSGKGATSASNEALLRGAAGLMIGLYMKRAWRDSSAVNSLAEVCLLSGSEAANKVSTAAVHLFLGNNFLAKMTASGDGHDSEAEEAEAAQKEVDRVAQEMTGAGKKTKGKTKRLERAKKAAEKKRKEIEGKGDVGSTDFTAIDLLHDPQNFAERLLQRCAAQGNEAITFTKRSLLLSLCCRLVGRHELILLNLYPFLQRHLKPSNRDVTKTLACLATACHPQVPPTELQPVVRHVINNFISESCPPEVMAVGLNAVREICSRAPLALDSDQLADLIEYRKYRQSKSVSIAGRALMNLYREVYPSMLQRSLRGKEASQAISKGVDSRPEYGREEVADDVYGASLLNRDDLLDKNDAVEEACDDDDEEEAEVEEEVEEEEADEDGGADDVDEVEEEEEEERPAKRAKLAAEVVLGDDDFKNLRKLRLRQAMQLQLGDEEARKEYEEEAGNLYSSDEEGSSSDSDDDDESLLGAKKVHGHNKMTKKQEKLMAVKEGRESKDHFKNRDRRGGTTNKEKRRNKPMMMGMNSERIKNRRQMRASDKLKNLQAHVRTLKKQVGPQKRRRK
ncbi:Protein SDA1 [Perkinsus olseni]|uniref:Protein SDA1 n=2 Tax=Perkinsus olseni TaxID=32597 RepID=A0A7J6NKH4_PEROL|nr:Protein SDA1 [Perkinsus olseni]